MFLHFLETTNAYASGLGFGAGKTGKTAKTKRMGGSKRARQRGGGEGGAFLDYFVGDAVVSPVEWELRYM